jgi:hypothetical protein
MKQVLLTIDGNIPTHTVFRYAVALCKRISAELSILQFIKSRNFEGYLSKTKKSVFRVGKYLENSFAAVTYAEAGEHGTANEMLSEAYGLMQELLPESEQAGVPFQMSFCSGKPDQKIPDYVDNHQDIILTIFDYAKGKNGLNKSDSTTIERIKRKLVVPLVVIK